MSDVFTVVEQDIETVEETEKRISYDRRIIPLLEDIKRAPLQENDSVILITGRPGTGKSKLAQDIAYYLDPTFNIDRIVFNHNDLIEAATTHLQPGSAIIFDEAAEATDSIQTLSQKNQRMGKFLATVRSRCLFIILIQPSYWQFQMSIATERADVLFHVTKKPNRCYDRNDPSSVPFERGFYDVYNFESKKRAYIGGKKWHTFPKGMIPDITDVRFGGRWVIDKKEYQRRKDIAVAEMNKETEAKETNYERKDGRVNDLRLKYLKSIKDNWSQINIETVSQLLGETKSVLIACMDYETRQRYGLPHISRTKREVFR